MILTRAAIVLGLVCLAKTVAAESRLDTVTACTDAILSGDAAAAALLADEILSWGPFFGAKIAVPAEQCVQFSRGPGWIYSHASARVISPDEVKQREADRQAANRDAQARNALRLAAENAAKDAAAAARAAKEVQESKARAEELLNLQRIAEAVYEACSDLLTSNRTAALTNEVCLSSFHTNGLPK